jgi:hypothetical protein
MLIVIQDSIKPKPPTQTRPIYDMSNVVLAIPPAVGMFRDPWRARLGFSSQSKIDSVHWARLKALSRRFAELGEIEYSGLMPVADFSSALREKLSYVLADPLRWEPEGATEEMKRQVINEILDEFAKNLAGTSKTRLFQERTKEWRRAYYDYSGPGSTRKRAQDIDALYDMAAPIPSDKANENVSRFVATITGIVRAAVEKAGGKFQ